MRYIATATIIWILAFPATSLAGASPIRVRDVGNWHVECSNQACLVTLYKTGSGDNSVVVKVDKPTMKPDNFGFLVSGNIDKSKGIVVTFARTTVDSNKPGCAGGSDTSRPTKCYQVTLLDQTTFNGSFEDCKQGLCFAKTSGQYVGPEGSPGRIDLLRQFEDNDFVIVIHENKGGTVRRVMLNISGFRSAYEAALSMLDP